MDKPNRKVLLLVEDDPNDVLFMRMAMKHADLPATLHVVDDGSAAIAYLAGQGAYADRSLHPLPCLVLLDTKLPRVMGTEVLKWVRERPAFDTMVVIMLTSSQQPSDVRLAYSLGANAYLVKPAAPALLARMIDAINHFWLEWNHPTAAGDDQASAGAGASSLRLFS